MRSARLAAAVAVVLLTATLPAVTPGRPASAAIGGTVWSDEFDGPAGAGVDPNRWRHDLGGGGWGNGELQEYTAGNVALDGQGHLAITARREADGRYTSGRIHTSGRFAQAYGRVEASIRVPRGQGIWPAFWMLGGADWPHSGEIDIMENIGSAPHTVHGTVHGPGYSGGAAVTGSRTLAAPLGDTFHTYRVDWSPGQITWYLDGAEYFRVTPAQLRGNRWVFDHPFFLILNLAVGGAWPGYPDGGTVFPQTMLVDWVRVAAWYDPPPGETVTLRSAASGRCIDVPSGLPADGTRLQLYDCNGSGAQSWTLATDGTVRALGSCLDAAAAGTANGTPIQLAWCNGTAAQRFTLSPAGDLVNIAANRCVDVVERGSGNGALLQLWDCAGTPNQKWSRT